ncbi:MAG: hypothetical protein WC915_00665 [archaeon]|jgi:hypothetical protein
MKRFVALKNMKLIGSNLGVHIKRHLWPGRNTDIHEAIVSVNRNFKKKDGSVKFVSKEKEFVVKRLKKADLLMYHAPRFGVQVDMHQSILRAIRKSKSKLRIVPTLRLAIGAGEELLIRSKIDALSITQFSRTYPEQFERYWTEQVESHVELKQLGFRVDPGAISPVKCEDGLYHPMLIDFDSVEKI